MLHTKQRTQNKARQCCAANECKIQVHIKKSPGRTGPIEMISTWTGQHRHAVPRVSVRLHFQSEVGHFCVELTKQAAIICLRRFYSCFQTNIKKKFALVLIKSQFNQTFHWFVYISFDPINLKNNKLFRICMSSWLSSFWQNSCNFCFALLYCATRITKKLEDSGEIYIHVHVFINAFCRISLYPENPLLERDMFTKTFVTKRHQWQFLQQVFN